MMKIIKVFFINIIFSISLIANWSNIEDYNKVYQDSNKNFKPFLIYFHMDNCKFCEKYENTILNKKELFNYLNNKSFYYINVNVKDSEKHKELFKKYKGIGVPLMLMILVSNDFKEELVLDIPLKNKNGEILNIEQYIETLKQKEESLKIKSLILLLENNNKKEAMKLLDKEIDTTNNLKFIQFKKELNIILKEKK